MNVPTHRFLLIGRVKVFLFLVLGISLTVPYPSARARYHPAYRWHTVRTDHFIIYYPQGHEGAVQRLLPLSERVYQRVTGYLGVNPPPCPIVLDPGTDLFNGYLSLFPSRISLMETPRQPVHGLGPVSDLMELVFVHEYTHFVHVTTRGGWYGKLSPLLGPGLAVSNILSPGWLIEGAAVNAETSLTDGGRGRSPQFLGEMRSFVVGPGLWNLNSAAVTSPYHPPRARIYLAGYHMVEYLNRTYGADALARLGRYQAEHPLKGTSAALKAVTGKNPEEFYRDFEKDYLSRSEQIIQEAEAAALPSGRLLVSDPRFLNSYDAHFWTEQGTILAFRRGFDRPNALVEIDPPSGSIIREIKTGRLNPLSARRLPDGRFLLTEIFYHPLGEKTIDTSDMVLLDPLTLKRKRLTVGQHIYSADLSPDGRTIAATRRKGMWIELVLLTGDGTPLRPLISRDGLYFDSPRWSPDGSLLAAVVKHQGKTDIVLIDPQTGALRELFRRDGAEEYEPEFSSDGRWLLFTSDRSGVPNIYAWDLLSRTLRQITAVPYGAGDPHLSKDGKFLSYSNLVRGVREIRLLPFDPSKGSLIKVEDPEDQAEPPRRPEPPDVSFEAGPGIPLRDYLPYAHFPYFWYDQKGSRTGIYIMGGDPVGLNTYSVDLFQRHDGRRPGVDIRWSNQSFWPTLSFRVYDTSLEGNTVERNRTFPYRERGGELSVGLDLIHRAVPEVLSSWWQIGARFRRFQSLDDAFRFRAEADQSVGFFGMLQFSRRPDSAPRDLVPAWGQDLYLFYEQALSSWGGELPGHNGIVSFSQAVPSPLSHHGWILTVTYQSQSGPLVYNKDLSLPRGYGSDDGAGGWNGTKNLLLSAEYRFPLRYTDGGLGHYFYHSDLFKGALFLDHGAGWDKEMDWEIWKRRAVTSVGLTLSNRGVLLALLPLELGLTAGYKIPQGGGFFHFFLKWNR